MESGHMISPTVTLEDLDRCNWRENERNGTDRQTDRQTDRHIDRQTRLHPQTDRPTDGQTGREQIVTVHRRLWADVSDKGIFDAEENVEEEIQVEWRRKWRRGSGV